MPALDSHPHRLGIFLFYDPEGIVDDYLVYLLRDMRRNLADLIVLANGKLTDEGRAKFREFTAEIHVRSNEGFDAGAWKEGLLTHCGFDRLRTYDELVLFNDSFFGPLYPFSEVFDEMNRRKVDFWGLSVHGEVKGLGLCPYGYRPRYLQTYFLVFGKRMLLAPTFREFWELQPSYRRFEELAEKFGAVLTKHFSDLGFLWSAYSDTADLEGTPEKNFDHHTFNLYEMVAGRRYPVIKRRSFLVPKETYLRFGNGTDLRDALDYVKSHCDYDLSLMFSHLLRKYDIGDLKDCLNLNYVLSIGDPFSVQLPEGKRIAVIAHLFYPELFPYASRYLRNVPPGVALYVTTDTEEKRKMVEQVLAEAGLKEFSVILVEPRGRDLAALLVGCKNLLMDYDYLCFVHDKKSPQKEYSTVGAVFCDMLWDSTLGSENYIRRILATFERDPHLGLLVPPAPVHGTYFKSGMDYWTICFDETLRLAKRLGLAVPIRKNKPPVAVGSVFWCRTDALQPVFSAGWNYTDFPPEPLANDGTISHALERVLPYVAQARGYLTGWAMTDRQAAAEIANMRFMLGSTWRAMHGFPGIRLSTFAAFRHSLLALRNALRFPGLYKTLLLAGRFRDYAAQHSPAFVRRIVAYLHFRRTSPPPPASPEQRS